MRTIRWLLKKNIKQIPSSRPLKTPDRSFFIFIFDFQ